MIITQQFILKQVQAWSNCEIKFYIQRTRLKYNKAEIAFYLYCIYVHTEKSLNFKSIYAFYCQKKTKKFCSYITYQAFMHNISTLCPLSNFLFLHCNKKFNIKPSSLINILDSTLVEEKRAKFIESKDWTLDRVTTRQNTKTINGIKYMQKENVCGYKAYIFINRHKQITKAELLPINILIQI